MEHAAGGPWSLLAAETVFPTSTSPSVTVTVSCDREPQCLHRQTTEELVTGTLADLHSSVPLVVAKVLRKGLLVHSTDLKPEEEI